MSVDNASRRPDGGRDGDDRVAGEGVSVAAFPGDDLPTSEPRAGDVVRYTASRTARARCLDCPARFTATGPAASHARAHRHGVVVDYRTRFTFLPVEWVEQAVTGGGS